VSGKAQNEISRKKGYANMNILELSMRREIELMEEIAELNKQILLLQSDSKIAREVAENFVSPSLFPVADKWLKERGL